MNLIDLVRQRTSQATKLSEQELEQIIHEDDRVMHDPFLYDGMSELVNSLYEFKQHQMKNPNDLLVIDPDYDTDGVMSAAVLSAALNVFGFNYRLFIPTMKDGYGLSEVAIKKMQTQFEKGNQKIAMILTADNGTNAITGVDAANKLGITVLVTDHHIGGETYANAKVIVNPNKTMPDGTIEPYPFKGNAGATVAWKTLMCIG